MKRSNDPKQARTDSPSAPALQAKNQSIGKPQAPAGSDLQWNTRNSTLPEQPLEAHDSTEDEEGSGMIHALLLLSCVAVGVLFLITMMMHSP